MNIIRSIGGGTVLAALLTTTAIADVTAEDVWSDQEALLEEMGYRLGEAQTRRDGDTLIVTDLTLEMPMMADDESQGEVVVALSEFRLRELGDGTVEMTGGETGQVRVTAVTPEGETSTSESPFELRDYRALATGEPGDIAYDWTASSLDFSIDMDMPDLNDGDTVELTINAAGIAGTISRGENRSLNSTTTADSGEYRWDITAAEGGEMGGFLRLEGIDARQILTAGLFTGEPEEWLERLRAGGSLSAEMGYEMASLEVEGTDPMAGPFSLSGTMRQGSFDISLDRSGLSYSTGSQGGEFSLATPNLPTEVSGSVGETGSSLSMPLSEDDAPQEFGLATRFVDLELSDEVWDLFDPSATFPRDPITGIIDLEGTLTLDRSLLEVATWEADDAPGQFDSVTLNDLRFSGVGALLTGTGSFTFDNSDMTTFDGMPRPEGRVDLRLEGGNALIDRLVTMGFVPQDQAMGARMMLGMFARPVEGEEDTLTSAIEVNEAGEVTANGQRIR